jgi:hypothetical protein
MTRKSQMFDRHWSSQNGWTGQTQNKSVNLCAAYSECGTRSVWRDYFDMATYVKARLTRQQHRPSLGLEP